MRRLAGIVAAVVVMTGCAAVGGTGTSNEPASTQGGEAGTSAAAPATGRPAPDFTLDLGEDGTFTLSQERKPVYLVFWAEW